MTEKYNLKNNSTKDIKRTRVIIEKTNFLFVDTFYYNKNLYFVSLFCVKKLHLLNIPLCC